jgi:PIN domain nuclease of toxin-antitoxin system
LILLDTHVLIWWVNGDRQLLSEPAEAAIDVEAGRGGIAISSMTAWEIAMLVARGRLSLSMDVTPWLAAIEGVDATSFVPVDREIAVMAVELPGEFHKDPADRIIVATARKLGLPIVTADEKIRRYPHVRTIW